MLVPFLSKLEFLSIIQPVDILYLRYQEGLVTCGVYFLDTVCIQIDANVGIQLAKNTCIKIRWKRAVSFFRRFLFENNIQKIGRIVRSGAFLYGIVYLDPNINIQDFSIWRLIIRDNHHNWLWLVQWNLKQYYTWFSCLFVIPIEISFLILLQSLFSVGGNKFSCTTIHCKMPIQFHCLQMRFRFSRF